MSVDIVLKAVGGPLGLRLASSSAGDGVSVRKVRPGSAACAAGLHTNDVLLSVNGVRCTDPIKTDRQLHDATEVVLKVRLPRPNPLDALNKCGSAAAGSSEALPALCSSTPVVSWEVDQVVAFVRYIELGEHVAALQEADVDGKTLLELVQDTPTELAALAFDEIGMHSIEDRAILEEELQRVVRRQEVTPAAAPAAATADAADATDDATTAAAPETAPQSISSHNEGSSSAAAPSAGAPPAPEASQPTSTAMPAPIQVAVQPSQAVASSRGSREVQEARATFEPLLAKAASLRAAENWSQAEPVMREALRKCREALGGDHYQTLGCVSHLAHVLHAQGNVLEAERLLQQAVKGMRVQNGVHHPETLAATSRLISLLRMIGRLEEAEELCREAYAACSGALGESHPDALGLLCNLASLLQLQGRLSEAEPVLRTAWQQMRTELGEKHPNVLAATNNLGLLLMAQGKIGEAEPLLMKVVLKKRAILGRKSPSTLSSVGSLVDLLLEQGKLREAETAIADAFEVSTKVNGDRHGTTLLLQANTARLRFLNGDEAGGLQLLRQAAAAMVDTLGVEHPQTSRCSKILASLDSRDRDRGRDNSRRASDVRGGPLHLRLKRGDGSFVEVDVASHQTVLELRQIITTLTSIPTAWVRLVFQGRVLKDPNATLAMCQLFHDAELQLVTVQTTPQVQPASEKLTLINEGHGLTEFSRKSKALKNKINTLLETGHWSTS